MLASCEGDKGSFFLYILHGQDLFEFRRLLKNKTRTCFIYFPPKTHRHVRWSHVWSIKLCVHCLSVPLALFPFPQALISKPRPSYNPCCQSAWPHLCRALHLGNAGPRIRIFVNLSPAASVENRAPLLFAEALQGLLAWRDGYTSYRRERAAGRSPQSAFSVAAGSKGTPNPLCGGYYYTGSFVIAKAFLQAF